MSRKSNKKPSKKTSAKTKSGLMVRLWKWLLWLLLLLMIAAVPLVIYLDNKVRTAFDGKKWAIPAKVYSRALNLYPQLKLTPAQLLDELQRTDYRRTQYANNAGEYSVHNGQIDIYRRAFQFWDTQETSRKLRVIFSGNKISHIYQANKEIALVRLEPQYIGGIFPAHNEDRELVELERIPPMLVAALVVTEDRQFFQHIGISLRGIARAMLANIKAGRFVQGGSTLTQQLVKNFFLTNERSLSRKATEAMMALLLEYHYSKEDILQAYMNEVYLGQAGRRAIHGFALAARFYFGKSITELNLSESATLVGLVKGASYYNPKKHPKRAKERRDLVLSMLQKQNIISQAQRIQAQKQPLYTASPKRAGQREYPAFLQLVRTQLQKEYRLEDLQQEGLTIFTTLDPALQKALETAASGRLSQLESWNTKLKNSLETAAIITSINGGEVRAMVGSRKPEFFGYNRVLQAKRSIGSLAKPIVYLTALQSGEYHWGSRISDEPIRLESPPGTIWQPKNYDRKSHGTVSLLEAMSRSYNQATTRLGVQVGVANVANNFMQLGVQQRIPEYPSILLGSLELTPFVVAGMYQTIASGGFLMPLRAIEAVLSNSGETLSSYAIESKQVLPPDMSAWLTYGMQEVVKTGTAKRLGQTFLNMNLAGKTGTSDEQRDAWFAGFDGRYLGVIWVGRDDNQPTPFTGSVAAMPIWLATLQKVGVSAIDPSPYLSAFAVSDNGEVLAEDCVGEVFLFIRDRLKSATSCTPKKSNKSTKERKKSWLDWLF